MDWAKRFLFYLVLIKLRFPVQSTLITRFRAIFEVIMPLEDGNGGPLSLELPVTYDIDSGE